MLDRSRFVYWPPNTKLETWQRFDPPANETGESPGVASDVQTTQDGDVSASLGLSESFTETGSGPDTNDGGDAPGSLPADRSAQPQEPETTAPRPTENVPADEKAAETPQEADDGQQPELDASISLDAVARFDAVTQRYSFEAATAGPAALRAEVTSASLTADSSQDLPTTTAATNASAWPFNSVALIVTEFDSFPGVFFIGTGVAIGPNTILTASHNVWHSNTLDEVDHVYVYPGFSGGFPQPGSGNPVVNDTGWTVDYNRVGELIGDGIAPSDSALDYAVINVNYTFDSWFGIGTELGASTSARPDQINMTGYPFSQGGTQENDVGALGVDRSYGTWTYNSSNFDPEPGNSGGPLWYDANPQNLIVDPFVVGVVSSTGHSANLGSSEVDQINGWLQSRGLDPITGVSSNNGVAGTSGGIGGLPDLVVTSLSLTSNRIWESGGELTRASYEVTNIGDGPSGRAPVLLYLSTDNIITTDDVALNAIHTPHLGAGLSYSETRLVSFSVSKALPGAYYVGALADYRDDVSETDETNNTTKVQRFYVTPFTEASDALTLTTVGGEWYALGGDDEVRTTYVGDTVFGGDGNDTIIGSTGTDTLHGDADDDTISGGDGADIVDGGDGNDDVDGGAGDDLLIAGSGAGDDAYDGGTDTDTISFASTTLGVKVDLSAGTASGAETDTDTIVNVENVIGGAGNDTITGDGSANTISGEDGNDTLTGGAGDDIANGGAGDDLLIAGSGTGDDIYDGGTGTDTISFASTTQGVTVSLAAGTATGVEIDTDTIANVENAEGGAGNDVIRGDGLSNAIAGLAGDDNLWAGIGDDHMTGGDGNDVLRGEAGNDTLDGGVGNDALAGHAGDDKLFGGAGTDFLYGNGDNDMLWGGTGNDVLNGNEGADILRGESGADYMHGGDGNDALAGHQGADQMFGGAGNDFLYGNGDDDNLWGGTGNDVLKGNEGADVLRGQNGNDYLDGGDDNDALAGHAGADTLLGGAGNDFLYGNGDNDRLFGGAGNDVLKGESGEDSLNGEDGNDYLHGGTGADIVIGGGGNDTLLGGTDADTFVFADDAGSDTILDWEDGLDVLDFAGVASVTAFAVLTITEVSGTQTDIAYDDGTGTVTLTILSSSAFSIDQNDTIL